MKQPFPSLVSSEPGKRILRNILQTVSWQRVQREDGNLLTTKVNMSGEVLSSQTLGKRFFRVPQRELNP